MILSHRALETLVLVQPYGSASTRFMIISSKIISSKIVSYNPLALRMF